MRCHVPRATRTKRAREGGRPAVPRVLPATAQTQEGLSVGGAPRPATSLKHQTPQANSKHQLHTPHTLTMAAAVADSLPPTTYGCSPALLLNSATSSSSTTARSSVASALAVGTGGAGASDAAGAELLPVSNVNVHPLVLLSVLDHHSRRQEGAGRVIGTLLGKRDGGQVR